MNKNSCNSSGGRYNHPETVVELSTSQFVGEKMRQSRISAFVIACALMLAGGKAAAETITPLLGMGMYNPDVSVKYVNFKYTAADGHLAIQGKATTLRQADTTVVQMNNVYPVLDLANNTYTSGITFSADVYFKNGAIDISNALNQLTVLRDTKTAGTVAFQSTQLIAGAYTASGTFSMELKFRADTVPAGGEGYPWIGVILYDTSLDSWNRNLSSNFASSGTTTVSGQTLRTGLGDVFVTPTPQTFIAGIGIFGVVAAVGWVCRRPSGLAPAIN